jgi:hypothetical protein
VWSQVRRLRLASPDESGSPGRSVWVIGHAFGVREPEGVRLIWIAFATRSDGVIRRCLLIVSVSFQVSPRCDGRSRGL